MENACIVGYGVVGQATARIFGIKKHYDADEQKSNISIQGVAACSYVFICLPTPNSPDGGYFTDDIVEFIRQVEQSGSPIYIIRSTVPAGFANHLSSLYQTDRFVSNPEFLTMATAEKDSKNPPFIILGGSETRHLQRVKGLYEAVIKHSPVLLTDNTSAELAKLALNSFFSLKVIYGNQIYDYAKTVGANYEFVRGILERHPYGSHNHFGVWFNGRRGVGGKCLPKDTTALGHYSGSEIIQKCMELNQRYLGARPDEN